MKYNIVKKTYSSGRETYHVKPTEDTPFIYRTPEGVFTGTLEECRAMLKIYLEMAEEPIKEEIVE
jgi:hypothetical protein